MHFFNSNLHEANCWFPSNLFFFQHTSLGGIRRHNISHLSYKGNDINPYTATVIKVNSEILFKRIHYGIHLIYLFCLAQNARQELNPIKGCVS